MAKLTEQVRRELVDRIIPFWKGLRDDVNGGYIGQVDFDLTRRPEADRGCILNSRILWFFSEAFISLGDASLLDEARHAFEMLVRMTDEANGGVYWALRPDGSVADGTKHTYNQAFAIYALSAYYRASGDGEDTGEYEALRLELPEEPMRQLTVDGESMALTLVLESAQEPGAPVGQQRLFNAEWARWGGVADAEPDTLVLSAELDDNLGDSFTYAWHFNGEVYRMLSNSGIKYVALKVGDDIAAFPTEGFTGGTKYTELKMLGVSTRRFDYTLTMKVNLDPAHVTAMTDSDFSKDCDLSIRTEVENMSYELSSSPQSIMYFYDVYLGPGDMMDQPFGQYRTEAQ